MLSLGFPDGSAGKERTWPMQETQGIGLPSLGQEDTLGKEMAPIAVFLPRPERDLESPSSTRLEA